MTKRDAFKAADAAWSQTFEAESAKDSSPDGIIAALNAADHACVDAFQDAMINRRKERCQTKPGAK